MHPRRSTVPTALLGLFILCACAGKEQEQTPRFAYRCNGFGFSVAFQGDTAIVRIPSAEVLRLPIAISASGARYTDGANTYWEHQGTALLELPDTSYSNCVRGEVSSTGTPRPPEFGGETDPVEVIRRYYAAIEARDFQRAYELWGNQGAASHQTFEQFAAGFTETARVEVEVGEMGPVEGAVGSRYVVVPVVIRAETTSGENQRFEGEYTLRRSVVDGASQAQRQWHLYSASIERSI